jgi:hypothetical protein
VAVVGYGVFEALFEKRGIDPIGKPVRVGGAEYTVIGVVGKRPSPGGFAGADDFAIIPYTALPQAVRQREAAARPVRHSGDDRRPAQGGRDARRGDDRARDDHAHSPRPDARQGERLRLVTSDAILAVWDQISRAILLAAGGDLLDRPDGRRHRRDGDHDHLGDRAERAKSACARRSARGAARFSCSS